MSLVQEPDGSGKTITLIDLETYRLSTFGKTPEQVKEIFENVPKFTCRDDDVIICSFPKTGTNWLSEIVNMILKRKAERIPRSKTTAMLEFNFEKDLQKMEDSPRALNTQLHYKYLPKDLQLKKLKTILIHRNPKDTLVSYYNFHQGIDLYEYDGKWDDWLPMYLDGKLDYGLYDEYLIEWEEAIKNGIGFPLHIMYYEDLKEFGMREMQKLCSFLGADLDTQLMQDILEKCHFKKMAEEKISKNFKLHGFKNNFNLYRKGEIGDWKNWFTVAQSEMFDKLWNKTMAKSMFRFRYEPSLSE